MFVSQSYTVKMRSFTEKNKIYFINYTSANSLWFFVVLFVNNMLIPDSY
jgi:hypothetical protein